MELRDVKVLLTGGTSGIGLKTLEALNRRGARVVVVARDRERLKQIEQAHPLAGAYVCDLADPVALAGLGAEILSVHSDLQVLINNAAIQRNRRFDAPESTPAEIAYEMQANLLAPLLLCRTFLPLLQQQPGAAIVNVTSGLALVPKRSAAVYCASKGGLRIFSQALRNQMEGSRVRVIEVLPPVVDTPMTAGRGSNIVSPDRVADAIVGALEGRSDEVYVGMVNFLHFVSRLSPALARRLMKRLG